MKESNIQLFRFVQRAIHPPLPPTAREYQKVLTSLTSSFRQHLDNEHPPVQSREKPTSNSTDNHRNNRSYAPPRATDRTDKHLSSIFDHPLFNRAPSQPSLLQTKNRNDRDGLASDKPAHRPDPLDVLTNAMASGTADPQVLHRCLKAHRSTMRNLSDVEVREKMKNSKFGSRVASWYLAADSGTRMLFFGNRHTIALAMPYLASEGLQANVIEWLKWLKTLAYTNDSYVRIGQAPVGGYNKYAQSNVLYEFIEAEVKYNRIDNALESFIQACRLLPNVDECKKAGGHDIPHSYLYAAYYLARCIASPDHVSDVKRIPVELFDQFCDIYGDRFCTGERRLGALLSVYHPTKPTPDHALEYLRPRSLRSAASFKQSLYMQQTRLSLEAADLCIRQDRLADASWLMEYAKQLLFAKTNERTTKTDGEIISLDELSARLAPTLG